MTMRRVTPASVRFWSKVQGGSVDECWEWQGWVSSGGYGQFRVSTERRATAHRWAYEHLIAPIPDGLLLDHLCRNRRCVNPWHLDPVTHTVNVARGEASTKTHCKNGHPLFGSNLYRPPGPRSRLRMCRACRTAFGKSYRARKALS